MWLYDYKTRWFFVIITIIIVITSDVRQMAAGEQTESVGLESHVQGSQRFGRQGRRRHDLRGPVRRPMGEHGEADTPGAHPVTGIEKKEKNRKRKKIVFTATVRRSVGKPIDDLTVFFLFFLTIRIRM